MARPASKPAASRPTPVRVSTSRAMTRPGRITSPSAKSARWPTIPIAPSPRSPRCATRSRNKIGELVRRAGPQGAPGQVPVLFARHQVAHPGAEDHRNRRHPGQFRTHHRQRPESGRRRCADHGAAWPDPGLENPRLRQPARPGQRSGDPLRGSVAPASAQEERSAFDQAVAPRDAGAGRPTKKERRETDRFRDDQDE